MKDNLTPLQQAVRDWYQDQCEEGYDKCLQDLAQHGCQSGMVSDLIYYRDTLAFYARHQAEIGALVSELISDFGMPIDQVFREWDQSDPFANETNNQNLLAWFAFEETARAMGEEL
jgi:hypothetical protein